MTSTEKIGLPNPRASIATSMTSSSRTTPLESIDEFLSPKSITSNKNGPYAPGTVLANLPSKKVSVISDSTTVPTIFEEKRDRFNPHENLEIKIEQLRQNLKDVEREVEQKDQELKEKVTALENAQKLITSLEEQVKTLKKEKEETKADVHKFCNPVILSPPTGNYGGGESIGWRPTNLDILSEWDSEHLPVSRFTPQTAISPPGAVGAPQSVTGSNTASQPFSPNANLLAGGSSFSPSGGPGTTSLPLSPAGIPHDPDAPLPSIGSAGHADGTCKRCCFYPRGRCISGSECNFCHFDHEKRKRKQKSKRNQNSSGPMDISMGEDVAWDEVAKDILSMLKTQDGGDMPQHVNHASSSKDVPIEIILGGEYEGKAADGSWWPCRIIAHNPDGTFEASVHDAFSSKWSSVHRMNIRSIHAPTPNSPWRLNFHNPWRKQSVKEI